ncbi:hypothetical protein LDENG_00021470 [Lucifuga dentata]|nr:hypothetical protein LDENG_00021470 [Lucifuga dentata]
MSVRFYFFPSDRSFVICETRNLGTYFNVCCTFPKRSGTRSKLKVTMYGEKTNTCCKNGCKTDP